MKVSDNADLMKLWDVERNKDEGRFADKIGGRKRGGFNDKKLLLDWDYEKNTVAPSEYSPMSSKKVFWKCHVCGYEWEAKIANRVHGRGCPCCSNKVVVPGANDLATSHPALSCEWNQEKNGLLTPRMVTSGCNKKVWWTCPNGHSYKAMVGHRTAPHMATNCPICNRGRQTSFRERAFFYYIKKAYPDAISSYRADFLERFELDIYLPSIHTAIEYDGAAWHKAKAHDKDRRKYELCRANGIKLIRIRESWSEESLHDIADQIYAIEGVEEKGKFEQLLSFVLDELDPRSNVWTRRDVHTIHSPVDINLERDRYEIMEYLCNVKESLAEMRPELVKEWHPTKNVNWKPNALKWKSERKVWWLCPDCGHEYEATPAHRVEGTGCPKCAPSKVGRHNATFRLAVNSLAVDTTEIGKKLLAEWHSEKNLPLAPADIAKASEKKVWWKCAKCGYEWAAKLANRYHGRGCPCCANRVVVRGKNDLLTLYPDLCKEWDYESNGALRPEDVVPGHNKGVWWICSKCGHKYKAPPNRRTSAGSGCRKCADKNNWNIRRDNPKNLPK